MLFGQAMVGVMAGKRARRKTWNRKEYIILIDGFHPTIIKTSIHIHDPYEHEYKETYHPSQNDMISDDWIIIDTLSSLAANVIPFIPKNSTEWNHKQVA